jgi:hypothetical protein
MRPLSGGERGADAGVRKMDAQTDHVGRRRQDLVASISERSSPHAIPFRAEAGETERVRRIGFDDPAV